MLASMEGGGSGSDGCACHTSTVCTSSRSGVSRAGPKLVCKGFHGTLWDWPEGLSPWDPLPGPGRGLRHKKALCLAASCGWRAPLGGPMWASRVWGAPGSLNFWCPLGSPGDLRPHCPLRDTASPWLGFPGGTVLNPWVCPAVTVMGWAGACRCWVTVAPAAPRTGQLGVGEELIRERERERGGRWTALA